MEFKKKVDEILKEETGVYNGFAKDMKKMLNKIYKQKAVQIGKTED